MDPPTDADMIEEPSEGDTVTLNVIRIKQISCCATEDRK